MNEQIRISPIRLIGAEGEQHGIVATAQALEMARESGLDLVEVADKERPPVCKIMDYGKFKYAQSKKAHQKTHQQKLKEIRIRPKTGDHDINTKIVQARQFLEHNDKVQVNVLFRGREMQHIEEGQRVMNQLLEALVNDCKLESPARMEGKRMVALLAPKLTGSKPGGGGGGGGGGSGAPKPPKPERTDKPEAKAEPKPAGESKAEPKVVEPKPAVAPPAPKSDTPKVEPDAPAPAAEPKASPAVTATATEPKAPPAPKAAKPEAKPAGAKAAPPKPTS